MKEIPKDSLYKYASIPFQLFSFTAVNDAMEMLKSSALIQKLEDKELAIQIIKTYSNIKAANERFVFFNSAKKELQDDLKPQRLSNKFRRYNVLMPTIRI